MTVNEKKTTDVHNNKHIEAESKCTDNSSDDSCENSKKTTELQTEKWQSRQKWAEEQDDFITESMMWLSEKCF